MTNDNEVQEIMKQVGETVGEVLPELLKGSEERPPFVYRDVHVFRNGGGRVCTTTSHTMARRICNALNAYTPNDRGY
jgi:hypothetical protein